MAFSPDGTRIVTVGGEFDKPEVKVWDGRTGKPLLELKGLTGYVRIVWFSPDGTRIVTDGFDESKVWDARTGVELKGEPIPPAPRPIELSPDGTRIAHIAGDRVELIPLQPDEDEVAYRRALTRPDLWRYREGYDAARNAGDDFAARFYLNLLPPPERKLLETQADAEREIAAGRTQDALMRLVKVSAARPDDTRLAVKVAALQAWFGQEQELADTLGRALEFSSSTFDLEMRKHIVTICCLRPARDRTGTEAALALARKMVQLEKDKPSYRLTLGMAEYRSGHFAEADAALLGAADSAKNYRELDVTREQVEGTSAFYRAMSLFRQGKEKEARELATEAAGRMKPLPRDEKNPLAGGATPYDLILWLASKESRAMIRFDAAPAAPTTHDGK